MTDVIAAPRRLGFGFWSFIVFMLALTALFAVLGYWQVERLAWKESLIAAVDQRMHLAPLDMPPVAEWVGLDPEVYSYRPVKLVGTFDGKNSVLVFTSLSDAHGQYAGPGYWVMTPMALRAGGTIFVNRGFVPQASGPAFAQGGNAPTGEQEFVGVALLPEVAGAFTPGPDKPHNIEWVRDPKRLAAMIDPPPSPVAGFTVEAPAGAPGALPQGGETVVEFPNNHLGYAMTWFGFAILTPALLAAWIWRQVRPIPAPPTPTA